MRRRNRITAALVSTLLVGVAACGEVETEADGEAPEAPESVDDLPEPVEWEVRFDNPEADAGGFQWTEENGAYRVTTGPAGITYRDDDLIEQGDYTVGATFVQDSATRERPEGYGLFVGGRDLRSPEQRYTYFLVRPTGEYLIKRREGEETSDLVGWTSSESVEGVSGSGSGTITNRLSVMVQGDSVRFLVNGDPVETLAKDEFNPYGIAGLRINHRLNLTVSDLSLGGDGEGGAEGERPRGPASDTGAEGDR